MILFFNVKFNCSVNFTEFYTFHHCIFLLLEFWKLENIEMKISFSKSDNLTKDCLIFRC